MTYAIIATRTAATMLTLTFEETRIKQIVFGANLTDEQYNYLFSNIPISEENLKEMCDNTKNKKGEKVLRYEVLPTDLSFDAFWAAYAYKVGEKPKCAARWNKMSDADRLDCLNSIKQYDKFLQRKGTAKKYPESYLNNRFWESDWKSN
jgi:hypothetical protein